MAKGMPRSEAVASIESTPVCGVEIRKDTVAPFDAPSRLIEAAVGITPQEHSGSGTPKSAAQITEFRLLPESLLAYILRGTNSCSMPAMKKPSNI